MREAGNCTDVVHCYTNEEYIGVYIYIYILFLYFNLCTILCLFFSCVIFFSYILCVEDSWRENFITNKFLNVILCV